MTEDDAKTKWCPHTRDLFTLEFDDRNSPVAATAINSASGKDKNALPTCKGSVCMMWRGHVTGHGYCGLAGPIWPEISN